MNGITVTGTGSVQATPDLLHLDFGVEVRSASASEAYREASAAARRVLQAVDDAGVPAVRRSVRGIELRAETTWSEQSVSVTGYVSAHRLSVTIDDLRTASSLLESVISAGGNHARVDSMSLGFSDRSVHELRAQDGAWQDAHARALRWAELSGCTLGRVQEISEGSHPVPLRAARMEIMAEQGMPIEVGTQDITRTVTARWAIAGE
ncbi:SIMPL domain-containing protein [Arthrobacter sp. H5]|uniref:SIMPL domain-containing protein n=1 Tax=Arthrobacter sp. H5 TaxID=1267973 RepID=UPI0004AF1317|nr:SIMPL domain-containing protein [Arthrobacter sp. H5]